MQSKRQANFELLRIVAMLMIIVLHYLNKGNIIMGYMTDSSAEINTGRFIEAFCIVSVNCYVLISGYFLVESAWKPERIVTLAAQVLFYSVLIPIVLACIGVISFGDLSIYDWLNFVLPIEAEHYWFATAYLLMYVFAPLLAAGIRTVEKRTLQIVILVLVFYFSVWKSVLPVVIATDKYGYEYGWFLCLFLIAAYIRLYGCPVLERKTNALLLYVGMGIGIFLLSVVSGGLAETIKTFAYYTGMPATYNHIFCLLGSVGLFMVFKNMKPWEGRAASMIVKLSPYTFGVYLLHEHILVRSEWMLWLGIEHVWGSFLFIPHMIGCVLIVYAVGTVVDYVRARIFHVTANCIHKKEPSR